MKTLALDGSLPADIERAARILDDGGLVAIPTETVYGLAARALDEGCVAPIFAAKGRPSDNPLILHVSSFDDARPLWSVDETSRAFQHARALADRFWPGPLTIVLPSSTIVPLSVRAGLPDVAVRAPRHDVARALLQRLGEPLAAPSANASGRVSPTTADDVRATLDGQIDAILDGGPCAVGIESTVVSVDDDGVTILRPGVVDEHALSQVVPMVRARALGAPAHAVPSPGVRHRHYAPAIETVTLVDEAELARASVDDDCAVIARASTWTRLSSSSSPRARHEVLPDDPVAFARALYAALYRVERAAPRALVIERLPDDERWRAVNDRLARACARD